MRLIYSQLLKLIPSLSVAPSTLGNDLAMMGHFVGSVEKIDNDTVFDLEIRQNRGDAQGYYGLAKDISVFYDQPLVIPPEAIKTNSTQKLKIDINAPDYVDRVMAVRISNIKNSPSPSWLKTFIELHQINSVNTLVDLTNYIMFLYGIPNHAFDTAKSGQHLIWELNQNHSQFTTLDGTVLRLKPKILMVNGPDKPLSLSFLGGRSCAIGLDTTETIIEMAVYDRAKVRSDSRWLKVITEAGIRLDKGLDPKLIPQAFAHLTNLIIEYCGGQVSSSVYDNYLHPRKLPTIEFHPDKPPQYAGIPIPADFSLDVLSRLGATLKKQNNHFLVTPPSVRLDIEQEEDLIEEVIRFYGYSRIPADKPISDQKLPDITPPTVYLTEIIKNILIGLGYDEIRSWPLIRSTALAAKFLPQKTSLLHTQNSINSEFPLLRPSLIPSLINQLHQYSRYKLPQPQFFEIGKIYFQDQNDNYQERHSLGIYHPQHEAFTDDIAKLAKAIGLPISRLKVSYQQDTKGRSYAEIVLDPLLEYLTSDKLASLYQKTVKPTFNAAYELTGQIHTLDANITLKSKEDPASLLTKYSQAIGRHLWQIDIIDVYQDPKTSLIRYTFRVSYFNTTSARAKSIHKKVFNLT